MVAFIRLPPPLLNGFRWFIASIANITHFEYAVRAIATAALPSDLIATLDLATVTNWGQLFGLLVGILFSGIWQVSVAALTHLQDTAIVLWWTWESHDLVKRMWVWLKTQPARAKVADTVHETAAAGTKTRGTRSTHSTK